MQLYSSNDQEDRVNNCRERMTFSLTASSTLSSVPNAISSVANGILSWIELNKETEVADYMKCEVIKASIENKRGNFRRAQVILQACIKVESQLQYNNILHRTRTPDICNYLKRLLYYHNNLLVLHYKMG